MSHALVVHSNKKITKTLESHLKKRGIEVLSTNSPDNLAALLEKKDSFIPQLVVIDMHMPDDGWLLTYQKVMQLFPEVGILFTTDRSDPNLIMRAKVHGAKHFLRAPYTEEGFVHALRRMSRAKHAEEKFKPGLPRIKIPVRVKITFPYAVLAVLIILTAAYLGSQVALESVEERFVNQLIDTAKLSTELMVEEENRMLSTLRLLLNTEGMVDAVSTGDSERLRSIALPVAVNAGEETVGILNAAGENILTLQHVPGGGLEEYSSYRGSFEYAGLAFVQNVYALQADSVGDKFAGLARHPEGVFFYVTGPLFDDIGNLTGVVLIGKSTDTLARQMRENTLAHISFYDKSGQAYSSTLFEALEEEYPLSDEEIRDFLTDPEAQSFMRPLSSENQSYREVIGEWKARGDVSLGLIGVSSPETILIRTSAKTNTRIFLALAMALVLVVGTGIFVANTISKPLLEVVDASAQVSQGNLDVQINTKGNDEVAVLAASFNMMIDGLREGTLYRDLLGRAVSPEIRDTLRDTLRSGGLRLEGQDAMATVMLADVQGFTTISELEDPTTILNWLNELFGKVVPIITSYSGVINEFSGDALFAFFGILPTPLHMAESAYLACRAGLEMLSEIEDLNENRKSRGDPPMRVGIGINTGPVTAGGLGTENRLHYTIIGDTVNTTQRIEGIAHQLPESAIMISKPTAIGIWDHRDQFRLQPHGEHEVKGKQEVLEVFRLYPKGAKEGYRLEDLEIFS